MARARVTLRHTRPPCAEYNLRISTLPGAEQLPLGLGGERCRRSGPSELDPGQDLGCSDPASTLFTAGDGIRLRNCAVSR